FGLVERGHSSASGANQVKDEIDCIDLFENTLEERKLMSRADMDELRAKYTQELLDASKQVRGEPAPDPSSIWDYIFADKNYVAGES
ncbi:MAG: hypothetical protein WKG01_39085, partial [Kofleriaceae bacterium]